MTEEERLRIARGRRWSAIFGAGYMIFLIQPVVQELTSSRPLDQVGPPVLAVLLFVALNFWFWLRISYCGDWRALAVVGALCAIAIPLTVHESNWAGLFIYCGVTAAATGGDTRRNVALVAAVGLLTTVVAVLVHGLFTWYPYVILVMALGSLGVIGSARLVESNRQLRQAREEVARLAVAEERLRFARDLHDLLGHSLSVIVLKSELAGRLAATAPERAASEVGDIERVARDALREVRDAVAGYRQPGLGQELESAPATLAAAGVEARVESLAGTLPAPIDGTLAWAVREGVTNVVRHSRARSASIRVVRQDDEVELELLDDGVGCDGCADGNGLRGLRERAAARGGSVVHGAGPDGGFRLAVRLPLTAAQRQSATAPA
jgi:two-component system, NarL family, sensor histidine kinase DesK